MEMQLSLALQNKWKQCAFETMTPVQSGCYNLICNKQDVVAISPTGTGKTLAYILPLLSQVESNGELQVLVLVPSQELAQQVAHVWREWSELSVQTLTGGSNLKRQIEQLKQKPEIIVATPGRLNDIATQSKKIKFHQLKTIVLDEVDYLLQDEHLPTIRQIVKRAPSQRQLLFFSATQTPIIYDLSKWFNTTPLIQTYVKEDDKAIHGYLLVDERKRVDMLKKIAQNNQTVALVFFQHVAELAMVYEKLTYHNISVATLHSDMHHTQRKNALDKLRSKDITFLLTTDVSARGIDIVDLPMVIHYDLPREKSQYIHRSGRTGRMRNSGLVISFISDKQLKEYKSLLPKDILADEYQLHSGVLMSKTTKTRVINHKKSKNK
ncbi:MULTISPECIES: DEAD/DEAH box helicase [unclassified Granulicatella]|uniref:DEAD/DEAH box helicase n=1 Tax=unclassified Granulicatella TaxID=2630493 RepID=UPI00107465B8|nr:MULTISPECIES: DEAD/DEAH box helicase [unclassified Granulicatella]MBF0781008.1 DEAD/DEAH box helicase [Granulicatella sp. 19428wC4_WM01]TFU92710.1 DEAD/DEAH box helicase [Granulicatella sp. WM01]